MHYGLSGACGRINYLLLGRIQYCRSLGGLLVLIATLLERCVSNSFCYTTYFDIAKNELEEVGIIYLLDRSMVMSRGEGEK